MILKKQNKKNILLFKLKDTGLPVFFIHIIFINFVNFY